MDFKEVHRRDALVFNQEEFLPEKQNCEFKSHLGYFLYLKEERILSKEYSERIRPIKEDGIKSIEAQIEYKQRKKDRLETFFRSDKNLKGIKDFEGEIDKLKERLERRIRVSHSQ